LNGETGRDASTWKHSRTDRWTTPKIYCLRSHLWHGRGIKSSKRGHTYIRANKYIGPWAAGTKCMQVAFNTDAAFGASFAACTIITALALAIRNKQTSDQCFTTSTVEAAGTVTKQGIIIIRYYQTVQLPLH